MLVHTRNPQSSPESPAVRVSPRGQTAFGQSREAGELLQLQRTIGNQAVQRLLNARATPLQRSLKTPAAAPPGRLFREEDDPVPLTGVSANHPRITVPPEAGLSFSATKAPRNASDVVFSLSGDNAAMSSGTTIDSSSGAITVADDQTGGSAHVEAQQTITADDGSTNETTVTAPFNFTAIPTGIASTDATVGGGAGKYGGEFTHTFASPGGGQTALENARVNEFFPAASGRALSITGEIGSLAITVNNPTSAAAGWDLDSGGEMAAPDHVTWSDSFSARPFIANASNAAPAHTLPQELTATQEFRPLSYPGRTYSTTAAASNTHRRAFELRDDHIKAVTSANGEEVVEDYVGPTVFLNSRATPDTIPAAVPAPEGETAPAPTTSSVSVEMEGQAATPRFSIRPPNLGCTISAAGELTPGTTPGVVTVRAGDRANYDETTVTLTAPPAAEQEGEGEQGGGSE